MKLLKRIALAAFLTAGTFCAVLYTSCSKDECKGVTCNNGGTCSGGLCTCTTGYEGASCDTAYRSTYTNTYKGNGTDNATPQNTYTGWYMVFTAPGSDVTAMQLVIQDNTTSPVVSLPIVLSSFSATGTVFTITSTSSGGSTYTGSGTITAGLVSNVTIVETNNTTSLVTTYSFPNMQKQ